LDKNTSEYFADVLISACSAFEDVEYHTDITPERSILQIIGKYGQYQIFITELFSDGIRKYRY